MEVGQLLLLESVADFKIYHVILVLQLYEFGVTNMIKVNIMPIVSFPGDLISHKLLKYFQE